MAERPLKTGYGREPEPPLEPPEERPAALCGVCGGEIYQGEVFGEAGGRALCRDCLEDQWRGLLPAEKFALLGCSPVTARLRGRDDT